MDSSTPSPRPPPSSDLHRHLGRLKNLLSCSICHGVLEKPACLPCNHHFCMSCLLHSMKEISACPRCKQIATSRQAKFSPDVDDIVGVFRKLEESTLGSCLSEVTNRKDLRTQLHSASKKENHMDEKIAGFHANAENDYTSPTEVKRQRWDGSLESQADRSLSTTELGTRKRSSSSAGILCRGILPASKRIHLPYPPVLNDVHDLHPSEGKHEVSGDNSTLASEERHKHDCDSDSVGVHGKVDNSPTLSSKNDAQKLEQDCIFQQHKNGDVNKSCMSACVGSQAEGQENAQSEEYTRERLGTGSGNTWPSARVDSKLSKLKLDKLNSNLLSPQDGTSTIQSGDSVGTPVLNTQHGTCAFCHKCDSQVAGTMIHYKEAIVVNLGGKKIGQISCVHKNCAEWAPGVYYEDEVVKNVPQEVVRGHKIKCNVCGLRGAVLGCYVKRCRKSFHYPCAQTLPCRWDLGNFLVLCPEHSGTKFPDEGRKGFKSCFSSNVDSAAVETEADHACLAIEQIPVSNTKVLNDNHPGSSSDVYVPTMETCTTNEQSCHCDYTPTTCVQPIRTPTLKMKSSSPEPEPKAHMAAVETSTPDGTTAHYEYKQGFHVPSTETSTPSNVKIGVSMEEHSVKWPASKWVLCASGLNASANELLAAFVRCTGVVVERAWSSRVTHLISGTDEMGAARRTFKYLIANLEGKWILKVDWLSACMAAGKYVNEEPYEVSLDIHGMIGGPRHARGMAMAKGCRLFHGLRFYFMGSFVSAYKADLQALLKAGGGEILAMMPDAPDVNTEARDVIVYSKDVSHNDMEYRDEVIKARYVEAKSYAGIVGSKVVSHIWILDSVAAYELQPFE